jgi:DNA polymerase-3 subunit epsilon
MKKTIKTIYIDVETTGLDAKKNGLIQLAGIIEVGGVEKEKFNFNVSPFVTDVISKEALEKNNVKREDLLNYQAPHKVYREFKAILENYVNKFDKQDKFHFVAYNAPFDTNFVREFFLKNNDNYYGSFFHAPSICVMNMWALLLRSTRHELENFQLGTVYEHVMNKKATNLHDAMQDIKYTKELYKKGLGKIFPKKRKK